MPRHAFGPTRERKPLKQERARQQPSQTCDARDLRSRIPAFPILAALISAPPMNPKPAIHQKTSVRGLYALRQILLTIEAVIGGNEDDRFVEGD